MNKQEEIEQAGTAERIKKRENKKKQKGKVEKEDWRMEKKGRDKQKQWK